MAVTEEYKEGRRTSFAGWLAGKVASAVSMPLSLSH